MGLLRMDFLHCALLLAIVFLAVYVARGSGLLREGVDLQEGGDIIEQALNGLERAIS